MISDDLKGVKLLKIEKDGVPVDQIKLSYKMKIGKIEIPFPVIGRYFMPTGTNVVPNLTKNRLADLEHTLFGIAIGSQ